MTANRATGALVAITLVLGAWMYTYLDQQLDLPLRGTFWSELPTGAIERADVFMPYSVLWPAPQALAVLAALAGVAAWLSARALVVSTGAHRAAVAITLALSLAFAAGVFFGAGTRHYLAGLTDRDEITATVSAFVQTPCTVRKKGDYAVRTVVVFEPPTRWGSHLWIHPGLAWMDDVTALEPGMTVRLSAGRDANGLGVLVELPEPVWRTGR